MGFASQGRKVLVLSDGASIANLLAIVKELGCENALDSRGEPVLASINPRQIDSAIVDLRCPDRRVRVHGIRDVWPNLVGRVLAITIEAYSPKTLEMVELCLLRPNSWNGLFHRLAARLASLLGLSPSFSRLLIPNAQRK